MSTTETSRKRKEPSGSDPAAAGGNTDTDYQRMQSYYVCAQTKAPVLFVVQGWFHGVNRFAFDAMQRHMGLGLELKTNDFYPLRSDSKVTFEAALSWYDQYYKQMNAYIASRNLDCLWKIPDCIKKTKIDLDKFVQSMATSLNFKTFDEAVLTSMNKHRVPAEPDSMVFFTGPHMVDSTPVRRLVCYIHSLSENTANDVLNDFPNYSNAVTDMKIPPNAQGKQRSNLVDAYLKDHFGEWGWERIPGLLIDRSSIEDAPFVAPADPVMVKAIKASLLRDSCYVAKNVLADSNTGITAADFETKVLECLATVIDIGLRKQEELKARLSVWIRDYSGTVDALLRPPDDPKAHEKVLKHRISGMDAELQEYAKSTLLRGTRNPTSASWKKFKGEDFSWPKDVDSDGNKVMRTVEEVVQILLPVPDGLLTTSVADGPLARLDGNMNNPKDLWQLVRNISGLKPSVELRLKLYEKRQIAHPHIGHWVSAKKPWNPPLTTPVGSWQNVYMLLTLGMFDSHYMPFHNKLRTALRPIIEQVWHASSRKPFQKVLFAPERFNVRELPNGGQPLQWHIDQDAIAPACP